MISNEDLRGDVSRRWRPLAAPPPLFRPDRARAIDRIIDYFGGVDGRAAPAGPVPRRRVTRFVPWSETPQVNAGRG